MTSKEEYLKRYLSGGGDTGGKPDVDLKKKKKKKKPRIVSNAGLKVFDEDVGFGNAVNTDAREDEFDEDEAPVVLESEEARRHKDRQEKLKNYYTRGQDGSGWVTVDEKPANLPKAEKEVDLSPPRRRARHDSPDSDVSPPRKSKPEKSPVKITKPKIRHDTPDSDVSPPRKPVEQKRAARHDTPDSDASPPRRPAKQSKPSDSNSPSKSRAQAPPRRRHDSPDSDISPPRKSGGDPRVRHDSPEEAAAAAAADSDSDLDLPRGGKGGARRNQSPGSDMSPPRRPQQKKKTDDRGEGKDLSPPRKRSDRRAEEPKQGQRLMTDGTASGLIQASQLQSELSKKKKLEEAKFAALSTDDSGRGAQTQYRDKSGRKVSAEELKEMKKKEREKKERVAPEWGGGLAQKRAKEEAKEELVKQASMPFARTRDDKDLNDMQKRVTRWGDPMADKIRQRGGESIPAPVLPEGFKVEGSGFKHVLLQVPDHSWIRRKLGPSLNRYGIKPGRHWDGVDRSNGYEQSYFKTKVEQQATRNAAYKWSVEDM